MRINTTATTPADTYVLTVQGSDGALEETTEMTMVVRSGVPHAPDLIVPSSGEENVLATPTFAWTEIDDASKYRLQIFDGGACAGTAVRDFNNLTGAEFTVPTAQALEPFKTYSWKAVARNACGDTASTQCFRFVTQSCATAPLQLIDNGGFEEGITGWIIDAAVPSPLVVPTQRHSGDRSLRLGQIGEPGTPTRRGFSEVHRTLWVPDNADNPQLSFWFYPQSSDPTPNGQQLVYVLPIDPPGTPTVLMNENRNDRMFLNRTYSLSAFRGQLIEIHFRASNGGADFPAGLYLDDVSVTFGSCGEPDFMLSSHANRGNESCATGVLDYTVSVISINGPNLKSPVRLRVENLPAGVTGSFATNPIRAGGSTTLTLRAVDAPVGGRFFFDILGHAETGPPPDDRGLPTDLFLRLAVPDAPTLIDPADNAEGVSTQATFRWDAGSADSASGVDHLMGTVRTTPRSLNFPPDWTDGALLTGDGAAAATYRLQIARDADFTDLVLNSETPDTSLTVPAGILTGGTEYFWRVQSSNACGASALSGVRRFVTRTSVSKAYTPSHDPFAPLASWWKTVLWRSIRGVL